MRLLKTEITTFLTKSEHCVGGLLIAQSSLMHDSETVYAVYLDLTKALHSPRAMVSQENLSEGFSHVYKRCC